MEAAPRSVHIKARSSFTHEESVQCRGQYTRWQWRLEQYDIAFSLLFTPQPADDGASTVVIHQLKQPIDSSHPLASSSYTHQSDRPGRLVFTFSNAHSAFRSKQLTLTVASFPSVPIPLGTTIASPLGPTTILARLPSSLYLCRLPYGTASLHPDFLLPHWPERDAQDGSRRQETSTEVNRRAMVGVWLFFTNHLEESEAFFRSEMRQHAMFRLAFACVGFLRALMTWERDDMQEANDRINATRAAVAHLLPADTTLASFTRLFSSSHPPLSDAELEATLITAETLILQALLLLVEENVMSLVQAGLRIRSSHRLFDRCWEEVKRRQRLREEGQAVQDIDAHVLGGVQNGMGTFLVVLSLLPPIMLRVLAFLGFSSSRSQGLQMLHASAACNGLRSPLSSLVLLFLHTIIPSFFTAHVQLHAEQSSAILASCFRIYPRGSFFLWMQGRQQRNSRLLLQSTASFLQAADGQREWRQLQHLCAYELGVSYAFMLCWEQADHWWRLLETENQWSKGFYAYMQCVTAMERVQDAQAAALQQQRPSQVAEQKAEAERGLIDEKIAKVVVYCDRKLGGKQLSLEQFILQRCDEWKRGRRLMLPTLEIVFLYHGFACMDTELLTRCLQRVEAELLTSPYWSAATSSSSAAPSQPVEAAGLSMSNHCLLLLLLSSLLHQLKRSEAALPHLDFILSHSQLTTADPFLTPFAQFELATVHLESLLSSGSGSAEEVKDAYRKASQWKGSYHFKNRLHLRIHLAVTELKQWQAGGDDRAAETAGDSEAAAAGLDETEGEDSIEAMSLAESELIAGIRQREEDGKDS